MSSTEEAVGSSKHVKGNKLEEQIFKSLGSQSTPEEKIKMLLNKSAEQEKENKRLNAIIRQQEKHIESILKEKDSLQKEYNKIVLVREKLQEVCREQQKILKAVKNESLTKIREEESRRKENQVKFQHSIDEISATLTKNNEENLKLKADNIEMRKKFMFLAEQYQVREKQLEKINEQVKLETQLNEAKLEKSKVEAAIEKEILLKEKQDALDEIVNYKAAVQDFESREKVLKEQLLFLSSKQKDFQSSLQNSNEMFVTYKSEIEKMHNATKRFEEEALQWKKKWEKSNASVIDLATEKQDKDIYISRTMQQMQQLQKLLRALQTERTKLYKTLKDNNIETPSMSPLPAEPPIETDKLDLMAKNCTELKKTLAKLQNEMNDLTLRQEGPASEQNKKGQRKKLTGKTGPCSPNSKEKLRNNQGSAS